MHFIKTAHLGSQSRNYRASTDKGNGSVVSQDCEKGVVILGGHVAVEQVVANQIAVTPPGVESEAKIVNSGPRGTTIALYRDGRQGDAVVSDQFKSWRHERRELLVQFERFECRMRCLVASMVVETTQQPAIWQ